MGKNLFILAILTMSLMACSTKEDVADEREPLKPETPVEKDEWETIQPDGGVIERDDITIQFPKGTFSSETKVAVSEVKKGQILGEDEVSKFYQITLPYSCAKEFKIKIKCDKNGDDINAVVHSPAMAVGPYQKKYSDITLESTYSNGEYTFTIPASSNKGGADNANLSVGIAKIKRIPGESAGTRAVGGISWHYDISTLHQQKYLANWTKADYPGSIKSALKHLQDLGFKLDGEYNLPVSFEVMDEGTSGYLDQDGWSDIWNGIVLNDRYITDFDNYNARYPVKRTCIHELLHYYQSTGYDPRWPVVKMATDGDERMMYECAAVWSEKFNDGGSPSLGFVSLYLPRFLTSLTEVKKAHESDKECKNPYADHGYGMAALIEYLTTQQKSEGFKDESVVELYDIMKNSSAGLGTELSGTTFDFLQAWTKKHNSKIFENDNYDDFILKLMTGKVYTEIKPSQAVNGTNSRLKEDGEVTATGKCYPYGAYINRLNLMADNNTQFKESGSLTNKQLVVEQKQDEVQTYIVVQYKGGLMQISGKAKKDSPLVIDGKTLESFRKGDNYNVNFYAISTNCKNQSILPTEVSIELKDQEFAITKITEIKFSSNVKMMEVNTGKIEKYSVDISTFDNYTMTPKDGVLHFEFTRDYFEDYGKGQSSKMVHSLEFDLVGFNEKTYDNRTGRVNCNVKNLTCSDYWKSEYGDGMVTYTIREYYWEISNMNPQLGCSIGYLDFGGEESRGYYTLEKYAYKDTWKKWNKPEESRTYTVVEDRDNIIFLKLEYEYTTPKK